MSVPMRKNRVAPPPAACPLTACMRVIGGAWKPHIIWYLRDTPRRFSELKRDCRLDWWNWSGRGYSHDMSCLPRRRLSNTPSPTSVASYSR
jgi:hypothetical protein